MFSFKKNKEEEKVLEELPSIEVLKETTRINRELREKKKFDEDIQTIIKEINGAASRGSSHLTITAYDLQSNPRQFEKIAQYFIDKGFTTQSSVDCSSYISIYWDN